MLNKTTVIRHKFGGGWATDFGPTIDVAPDPSGMVVLPFLTEAQNCIYELDGGPRKIGGTTKGNSSAVASGAVITGIYDYWRQGTLGTPTRRRVLHAGTVCAADTDNFIFASIFTGLTSGAVPCYSTFDDLIIISSDSTVDVPRSWDQTTAQSLAGSPPRFSFSCSHKNRQWAAGNFGAPSRVYYSANVDPEDWVGAGSGSIDIDPNDGDMVTGIASHKNDLWIFKGPNKGSIHRITGSSPTGGDAFARTTFVKGLGAAWHNAICTMADDLVFVSQYGTVHSLASTAAYGDFFQAALSRPINGWIREHINYTRLRYITAVEDPLAGFIYITMSVDTSTTNNRVLVLDYRAAPDLFRWSHVPAYALGSMGLFVDTNGTRRVLAGCNDGYVRRINMPDRSIDGITALSYKVTTPHMNYGQAILMKTLDSAAVGIAPKGAFTFTLGWTRDDEAQQTVTLDQGGGAVLGPATTNAFTLDTSRLAGARYVDRFTTLNEEGGEFRSVQFELLNSGVGEDIEVHSLSVAITPGALSLEN